MHYYSTDDRKGKKIGALAAFLYVVLWVLFMVFVSFKVETESSEQGIMLDIVGDPGDAASQESIASTQPATPQNITDELITQDHEEAPVVAPPQQKPQQKPTPPQERPREADPNALFRPSTTNTQGGNTASTESGSASGGYGGDVSGTGGGGIDSEYSVGQRSLVGNLPLPSTNYGKNKQGKVVVEIFVNEEGVVTQAAYKARGSTTTDSELVRVAIEAAKKAKFTRGNSDIPEIGTITYTFNLQ